MGKPKSKAAAKENGSEKQATKKTSKTAENHEAEATRTSKHQGEELKSGNRKSRSRAVETDGTLLQREFVEAGIIRVPTELIDPRESDDEKEKETLDNTNVVIGPNVKYLKSMDPSHVKEFVSACQSLRPDGWGRTKNYREFSLKLLSVAEANAKAHTRLKFYGYQFVAASDQEHKNCANKEKRKNDHSDATAREQTL